MKKHLLLLGILVLLPACQSPLTQDKTTSIPTPQATSPHYMEPNSPIPPELRQNPAVCQNPDTKAVYPCKGDLQKVTRKESNMGFYFLKKDGTIIECPSNAVECLDYMCADNNLCE